MKNKPFNGVLLLTSFLIIISVFSISVLAETLLIEVTPTEQITNFSTSKTFQITLTNNQSFSDWVTLTISGLHTEWISLNKYYFNIGNKRTENITLSLYPSNDIGSFEYTITAKSSNTGNISSQKIKLVVIAPKKIVIRDFTARYMEGQLNINLDLKSSEKMSADVLFDVLGGDKIIKSAVVSTEVDGVKKIPQVIELKDLTAGKYYLNVYIKDKNVSKKKEFNILKISNLTKIREIISTWLFTEVRISLTNNGNGLETAKVTENIPSYYFVTLLTNSTGKTKENNTVKYEFTITDLGLGKTETIIYRLENWPVIITAAIVVIVVLAIVLKVLLLSTKPRIKKSFKRKKKGYFTVVLEIKNALAKEISEVTVRDWVSALAKVEKKFEGMKPLVRESSAGTELIWKVGKLKKGEERLLHYTVKAVMHGHLKMPRAFLRYRAYGDRKGKVYSKKIEIKTE